MNPAVMRKLLFLLPVLLLHLGLPLSARAQISDERLGDRIAEAVRGYSRFTIFDDVEIGVNNRDVTLTGRVMQPIKKDELGTIVSKIDGVRSVVNNIGVLPISRFDDDIRRRIASQIYGHPSFWNYAQMSNPPIHIIVESGRVTLTGVVNSQTEKALAYSLSQVGGSFSVTNRLRINR